MNSSQRFKVYAKLLHLYPASYRKRYGNQLLQTVADMVDGAPSASEKFTIWLRISIDLLLTVCREHFQETGDYMNVKKHYNIRRNALISGALFLLPIILLTINRILMLSGPGRGVPTFTLLTFTAVCPVLAVALSGSALYGSWQDEKRPGITSLRRGWPLALVCLASLILLTLIVVDHIKYYTLMY